LEPTHSSGHEGGAQRQQEENADRAANRRKLAVGSFKVQTLSSPVPRHSNVVPASAAMQAPKSKKISTAVIAGRDSIRSEGEELTRSLYE
jgi:hypothetical protein